MTTIIFKSHGGMEFLVKAANGASVMEAAVSSNVPGIDAECGGVCACATCHVYVDPEWKDKLDAPGEAEKAMLEFAEEARENSRLTCQLTTSDALDGLVLWLPDRP
ncbi:2Fe-2S iron-sulfur cluster-binding protein [Caballeronia sp. LZ001]|uniref:2Fe-2S iron-sulfur cluster-binding protein n=1 Tax=Caballeronia sp. LZ001 TaxID=3038553 RepID=UPI00285FBCBD|nr:2Fe-2S iron-sulfur cluster-binding protein [Caballeronia sp. LZ001]MDR5804867.1 2Fe-2S iron-sulfur cluster-binding protein [Caballeronia sp. LZ001]